MGFFNGRRDRLDAFRAGDRQVLAELFHFYVDDLSALLRHGFRLDQRQVVISGVEPERERDLVQEVFLRAFAERARLAFNALLPYRPYLFQIARNLLVDEARRRGKTIAEVSPEELEQAPSLEPSADDVLEWSVLRAATAEYCQSLTAELQGFVRLRFEEGLSQRDLADRLQVSRRHVRTCEETVQKGLRAFLQARRLIDGPDS
jgi:RNA polymerase sigma factor (sigma-70 family)